MKRQKSAFIQVILSLLAGAAITFLYFYALEQLLPHRAVARYFLGTWGYGGYLLLLSLTGFLFTRKASYKAALVCSVGIPFLFDLLIFVFMLGNPDLVKIPIFNQYYEYHESVRFVTMMGFVNMYGGILIFGLGWMACTIREKRKNDRISAAQ